MELDRKQLDALLTLQLSVAWAGEGRCEPARFGWWDTALVDEYDGLDLLTRLLPETGEWAALEVVRLVARQVDDEAREKAASPDDVRSIYHLGFALDEQLDDRLAEHKRSGKKPTEALPGLIGFDEEWRAGMWKAWLEKQEIAPSDFRVEPGGRLVRNAESGMPPLQLVRALVGALHDPSETYPAPHILK
jgi:hypothetical protein